MLSEFVKDVLAAGIRKLDLSLNFNESLPDTKTLSCVKEIGMMR